MIIAKERNHPLEPIEIFSNCLHHETMAQQMLRMTPLHSCPEQVSTLKLHNKGWNLAQVQFSLLPFKCVKKTWSEILSPGPAA